MIDARAKLLTETELEMMTALWELDGGTVRDVMARLPKSRGLAYTSVSTILRILEKKGFVKSAAEQRTHTYKPTVKREAYEARHLRHTVDSVFGGEKLALVRRLLGNKVSAQEAQALRRLLDDVGEG